eukprot:TRINITY_DN8602_c0_g3_i1.p1 TRINITY_DN8602_c0_g3~~TRINITY_DN8602_c0_g3_i1.p1  ORF type:complete len:525 (-),score=16.12 TRINITY_DN8602_c0_g3_i1:1180-2754(-)
MIKSRYSINSTQWYSKRVPYKLHNILFQITKRALRRMKNLNECALLVAVFLHRSDQWFISWIITWRFWSYIHEASFLRFLIFEKIITSFEIQLCNRNVYKPMLTFIKSQNNRKGVQMALKVAINGFGRIGRCVARIIEKRDDVELVAINDLADLDMLAYLLRHDSVHGNFSLSVEKIDDSTLRIGGRDVKVLSERDPNNLKFAEYGAEVMLECTGLFLKQEQVQCHLDNGIKKVLFSAPAKDDTPTYVLGVNADEYKGEKIISNASCTTNCLAPVAKVLNDAFGIEKGNMTTIHSYTNDQNILDVMHKKEIRRARAAAVNMIPTTTGAAKALGKVIPSLNGKLHGHSVRVPTPDVSMVDLNVVLGKNVSAADINGVLKEASEGKLKGILGIDSDNGVSSDFMGDPRSSIVADDLTFVIEDNFAKVMSWYDNEWGYSYRLVDMALHISKQQNTPRSNASRSYTNFYLYKLYKLFQNRSRLRSSLYPAYHLFTTNPYAIKPIFLCRYVLFYDFLTMLRMKLHAPRT